MGPKWNLSGHEIVQLIPFSAHLCVLRDPVGLTFVRFFRFDGERVVPKWLLMCMNNSCPLQAQGNSSHVEKNKSFWLPASRTNHWSCHAWYHWKEQIKTKKMMSLEFSQLLLTSHIMVTKFWRERNKEKKQNDYSHITFYRNRVKTPNFSHVHVE